MSLWKFGSFPAFFAFVLAWYIILIFFWFYPICVFVKVSSWRLYVDRYSKIVKLLAYPIRQSLFFSWDVKKFNFKLFIDFFRLKATYLLFSICFIYSLFSFFTFFWTEHFLLFYFIFYCLFGSSALSFCFVLFSAGLLVAYSIHI